MKWAAFLSQGDAQASSPNDQPLAPQPPWPLVLMSFLGALMASLPIIFFFTQLLGDRLIRSGFALYLTAGLIIGIVCATLRRKRLPLFIENLALTLLLAGLGLLYWAIFRDLDHHGYLPCAVITLALAALIPVHWVQTLLAALAASLCYGLAGHPILIRYILIGTALTLLWIVGLQLQDRCTRVPTRTTHTETLEWILGGWVMAILTATVVFLLHGFKPNHALVDSEIGLRLLGILLSLSAAGWACWRWPGFRSARGVGALIILSVLAGFIPHLGMIALIGSIALTTGRRVQASAAALAALLTMAYFYYTLDWSLLTKAKILVAAGILLVAMAWRPHALGEASAMPQHTHALWATVLILFGAASTLAVVNVSIWQKEDIIAHGRAIYVALAPVDPRSLMQGDYMALNYQMAPALRDALRITNRLTRPKVVGQLDAHGVFTANRFSTGQTLSQYELIIELSPGRFGWVFVTDAWFFKEGDQARWQAARYGEFRVMPDGKALLVGLADQNRHRIEDQ